MMRGNGGVRPHQQGVHETLLAQAGKNVRAQMRALYPSLRADVEDDALREALSTPPTPLDDLDEVLFDSPAALKLAKEADLWWADFAHSSRGPFGPTGFTVEDVEFIITWSRDDNAR